MITSYTVDFYEFCCAGLVITEHAYSSELKVNDKLLVCGLEMRKEKWVSGNGSRVTFSMDLAEQRRGTAPLQIKG